MSNRWAFKHTDNYQVDLEQGDEGFLFIHVNIVNWNKSVYKELLNVWVSLETILRDSGQERIFGYLPKKNEEFAYLFDWEIRGRQGAFTLVSKEIK